MRCTSGPWDPATVRRWLTEARIPVRLAVLTSRGPLVVSLWYRFEDDALWCATRSSAAVVAHVRADPRVGLEVAPDLPPYRGVRGTGRAEVVPDAGAAVLEQLLTRYLEPVNDPLADLLRRGAADEVAIRISELRLSSWDFSARMRPQDADGALPRPSTHR
jgi:nitroimidazol reductase NimA-like FMN-containing flavoprotein (pyridoxamine 5'-phosphate oxidase superfamily)